MDCIIDDDTKPVSVVVDTGSSHLVVSSNSAKMREIWRIYKFRRSGKAEDVIVYGSQGLCAMDHCTRPFFEHLLETSSMYKKLPVGVVVKRKGTSNYSILGIGYNPSTITRKRSRSCTFLKKKITFSVSIILELSLWGTILVENGGHPLPQYNIPMIKKDRFTV